MVTIIKFSKELRRTDRKRNPKRDDRRPLHKACRAGVVAKFPSFPLHSRNCFKQKFDCSSPLAVYWCPNFFTSWPVFAETRGTLTFANGTVTSRSACIIQRKRKGRREQDRHTEKYTRITFQRHERNPSKLSATRGG